MATNYILSGATIIFSAGVAYGMVKVMLSNLKERMDKFEKSDDCEDIVRRLLFDDTAMPRFMPVVQCSKQHSDFASQLEKLEKKIDGRDSAIMSALERIHEQVKK